MTLEEILKEWEKDSILDPLKMAAQTLDASRLHHKYWMLLTGARLTLKKLESDYKVLYLEKYEFLTEGDSDATLAKGWKLPGRGRVLKAEVPRFLEADADLIKLSLKIGLYGEKVSLLEDIIRSVNYRSQHIKNHIDFIKFQAGA